MSGGLEQFIIKLVDQVSGPAKAAENASSRLEKQLKASVSSSSGFSQAKSKDRAKADVEAFKAQIAAAKSAEAAIMRAAKADEAAMKITVARAKAAAMAAAQQSKLEKANAASAKALEKGSGAMAGSTGKLTKMSGQGKMAASVSEGVTEALGGMASKALAVAGPLAAMAGAFMFVKTGFEAALDSSNFKTQTKAQLESMTGSADKAKETFNHIQRIADELVIGQDRAASMSTDLMKNARLPRVKLEESITALVALERGQGADASSKLESIIKGHALKRTFAITREDAMTMGTNMKEVYGAIAKQTGQGVDVVQMKMRTGQISARDGLDAMNALLIKKNKAALEAGNLDPNAMFAKAKETFKRIFEDVNLKPILDSVREFIILFDRSTVSGRAIRLIMTSVFNVLGQLAKGTFQTIRVGCVLITIAGLKLYIALFPALTKIVKLFKKLGGGGGEGVIEALGKAAGIVFDGLIAGISVASEIVGVFFDLWGDMVDMISGPAIFDAIEKIKTLFKDGFSIEAFMGIGNMIVEGIIAGITNAGTKFGQAAFKIKETIVGHLKGALGIHSPARALMPIGHYSMEGINEGAKRNKVDLSEHMSFNAGKSPKSSAKGASTSMLEAAAGPAQSSAGITVSGTQITINAGSGADAKAIADLVPGALMKAFEGIAIQLGQPVGV